MCTYEVTANLFVSQGVGFSAEGLVGVGVGCVVSGDRQLGGNGGVGGFGAARPNGVWVSCQRCTNYRFECCSFVRRLVGRERRGEESGRCGCACSRWW